MKIVRKLVLGVVTTGFVAATLAATTYAWYKLNNAAFTEDFTFNATTTEGFLVSIDGKTFKHKLSTVDMVKAMVVGKDPSRYQFDEKANVLDTVLIYRGSLLGCSNYNRENCSRIKKYLESKNYNVSPEEIKSELFYDNMGIIRVKQKVKTLKNNI